MKIAENIEFGQVYFIMGEAPKNYPARNMIKDPPYNGWGYVFLIRDELRTTLFISATCQSYDVPHHAYEVESFDPYEGEFDNEKHIKRLTEGYKGRVRHSLEADAETLARVLQALGGKVPQIVKNDATKTVPVKRTQERTQAKKRNPVPDNLKTIKDVSERLEIDAKHARAYLRKSNVEKPEWGWKGDDKWVEKMVGIIKKAIEDES